MTLDPSAVGALNALSWRGWVVHRGLARSGARRGEIDYVLVGPGGVFVVHRLPWQGPVEVAPGQLLLQGKPSVREVEELGADTADVLAIVPDVPVHAVLCLERYQAVSGWVRNVMVCGTSTVEEVLTSRPPVLSPERVQEVGHILSAHLRRRPPTTRANGAASVTRPGRALVQAAVMAVAALMVIGALQAGVGDRVATAVDDLVSGNGQAAPPVAQPRPETPPVTPSPDPDQQVEEGITIEVKGKQCRAPKRGQDQDRCRGERGRRDDATDRRDRGASESRRP